MGKRSRKALLSPNITTWFMVFSLRMKKQEFSHLEKQEFSHIYVCFHGWLCMLVDLFDVFHGCQHQIMDVLWFLSVRIWKTGTFSHLYLFLWFLSVRMEKQELSHIYGCQQQFMSVLCLFVVSENVHARRECYEIVWLT